MPSKPTRHRTVSQATAARPSAAKRGYGHRWRKSRLIFLSEHPLCVVCLKAGKHVPATQVDHIIPHKGDVELFEDVGNWQGLCESCHATKTASEDGGFGNLTQATN